MTSSWPSSASTGTRHAFSAVQRVRPSPSGRATITEQAPHSPSAQPSLAPVNPWSRSQSSAVTYGSISTTGRCSPLTITLGVVMTPFLPCRSRYSREPAAMRCARTADWVSSCSSTVTTWSRSTTVRPPTNSSSSGGAAPSTRAATGSAISACARPSSRQTATSACLPGSREPIWSSQPSSRAPPIVASSSASRTASACGPPRARANSRACRASSISEQASLLAAPSTPRPTGTPAARRSAVRAMPAPSRALDDGQCATPVPVSASFLMAGSSKWMPWASQTSSPSQSSASMYSTGVRPKRSRQNSSSSRVSARWVCSRTPLSRASAAACRSRSPVTENGEQGASPMRSIESGPGSW